jgi:hypothetical protein
VALLVVAWVAAAAFTALRASDDSEAATSAAMNTLWGDDPPAGVGVSCRRAPDAGVVLFRSRYLCEMSNCFTVTDRLEVTKRLRGRWSYRITEGGVPGYRKSGSTGPAYGAVPTLERESCPEEARGLLQHELEVWVSEILRGRPHTDVQGRFGGPKLRRALSGWSVREIAHARFKVVAIDLDARRSRVRVSVGERVRFLNLRLDGDLWRL